MANPVVTECPKGTWVKVATNVTAIVIRKLLLSPDKYVWNYIATTGAVPSDLEEAASVINGEKLAFASGSDIYVYAFGKAGRVRVDS
jgi:hypothetical protein